MLTKYSSYFTKFYPTFVPPWFGVKLIKDKTFFVELTMYA